MSSHVQVAGDYSRRYVNRLGLWFFIISESTVFAALLWARLYLQGAMRPQHLNQTIGLAITSLLLLSSLTAYRAEAAHAAGRGLVRRRWLLMTLGLGLVFLAGVGVEWREAFQLFPPEGGFGSIFFIMTGMHAFHVLTGLLMIGLLLLSQRRGRMSEPEHWGTEAVVKYWHFIDVVWVFFYPAIYLIS